MRAVRFADPGGPPPAPGTKPAPQTSGLYKMTDTNGDDVADTFEKFSDFVGGIQEHGPHAIRRGPDGIPTIILGNNTFYPDEMVNPAGPLGGPGTPNPSKESQFLPALPDGRGFGPSVKEGLHGTIARIDEEAKQYTLLVGGLRNAYDYAFNLAGEIFTFDSDMEWDINQPWYRDVRTVHGIPGGNYGYRNGSGKFPPYFIDSLPTCATSAADRRSASSSISTRSIRRSSATRTSKPTGRAAACSGPRSCAPARPTGRRRRRTSSSTASRSTSPTWKSGRTA